MPPSMNRRSWFRRAGAAAAGIALAPHVLGATPPSRTSALPRTSVFGSGDVPIRLSANENPYGPSKAAREAMLRHFDEGCRYPYEAMRDLQKLLAEKEGVSPEHIVIGSGSSEILSMAGLVYGLEGGEIVAAYPTYQGLTRYAEQVGAYVHWVPLDGDMAHDLEAMERRMTSATGLVFVCNPNNPTGTVVEAERLRAFCREASKRAVVFLDQAYVELMDDGGETMLDLVLDGHNVILSRTFSKIHGLAGLRVGYGIARPDIAERLGRYRMSSPNVLGLRAAAASYGDEDFQAFSRKKVAEGRRYVYGLLDELGLRYVPSQGNFVFFHTGQPIEAFGTAMQERGILVGRPFPPYLDWCRLSMGKLEDLETFGTALREMMPMEAG